MINSIVSSTVADMKKSAAPFATPLPISQILTAKKETIERISFYTKSIHVIPLQIPIEISPILRNLITVIFLLLNFSRAIENTKFVVGELSLRLSLVLYLPTGFYEL